jgi:16S rRNA pseudouridine516 synthase
MLNKPEGCVCSHADEHYPSVFDLFEALHQPLHVAGRLDVDTTGLVLVTGDGQWSHRITSPAHSCRKRYRVWLEEVITDKMIERLEKGVFLLPEKQRTRPAQVEKVADDEIVLTITEGRYHQVKRMLEVVENRVERLHREQIGDLKLDSALAPGEWRELTEAEIGLF